MQPAIMAKIRKEYINNPDFDPAKVANASSAAEGLCKWVLAMEIYDRVAKIVAPKKERMQLAEAELNKTLEQLKQKRQELKSVEERLLNLKQQFQEMNEKKEKLEYQVSDLTPCSSFVPLRFFANQFLNSVVIYMQIISNCQLSFFGMRSREKR